MQGRQKTTEAGCLCEGVLEAERNKGAQSMVPFEKVGEDSAGSLLGRILSRDNLNAAYKRVK